MTPKDWLDLVKEKPIAFGLETGFEDLTELHNTWLKDFLFREDDQTLQAHRGSYKTTVLAIALALMIILYPTQTILFMRKTDDDVKEIIQQVAKLLQSQIFQDLTRGLYDVPIAFTKLSAFEIDTTIKQSPRGTPQLVGIGSKASLTGKHFDVICTDDIINLTDRVSPAERRRTKQVYQELQNIKNRGGRFINTGTPWHKEDAFELMPNIRKYDCYETGLISQEERQTLQANMTPSLFAANYELKHISEADALFTAPRFHDGPKEDLYNGIGQIDAAYGGGDGSAFTIVKLHAGKILVLGKRWDKHIDDCLNQIQLIHTEYRAGTIHCERNADKGYLARAISTRGIPVKPYHEAQNKFIKISTILRSNWDRVYFLPETDPEYLQEILDYTEHAAHDDAPDSLATAIRILELRTPNARPEDTIKVLKRFGL